MIFETNNHSVFSMHYHLVLVVKYRRKVINDTISKRLKEIFEYIAPNYNITIEEWNHDIDHVHILFKAEPNSELSKFLNAYKSASSRLIKKRISGDKTKTLERIFLVKELLSYHHRWCNYRCHKGIYQISGRG